MCRGIDHGGRRCPGDSSEARRLRRVNVRTEAKHVNAVAEKPSPNLPVTNESPLETLAKMVPTTPEQFEKFIASINTEPVTVEEYQELDFKLSLLGFGVEYVAEQTFGAPSDADMKAQYDAEETELLKKKAEEKAEQENKRERERQLLAAYEEANNVSAAATRAMGKKYSVYIREQADPALEEYDAVEYAELVELKRKADELHDEYRLVKYGESRKPATVAEQKRKRRGDAKAEKGDSEYGKMVVARGEAYKKALEYAGVELSDGQSFEADPDSNKTALKAVKEAAAYYPKAWVEKSNEMAKNVPLVIKTAARAGHYTSGASQRKKEHLFTGRGEAVGWIPPKEDHRQYVQADATGKIIHPTTGKEVIIEELSDPDPGMVHWARFSYQVYPFPRDDKPRGNGWVKFESSSGRAGTFWRRPVMADRSTGVKAEITISADLESYYVTKTAGARIAVHELAHRFEDAVPGVKQAEEAFLKRRNGTYAGKPESLTHVALGATGYADNFPSKYSGRVYSDGSREIFSVGMESIFYGTNGGMVGTHNHTSDSDYKRTVLGILALGAKKS